MTPDDLRTRIARGENLHTELKRELGSDRELAKDLVCFANTDGGVIIFGVADDHTVVGVDDPDRVAAKVDDIAFQHCSPPITTVMEVTEIDGMNVVALSIPQGDQRPYRTKSGQHYVRTASGCRQASRGELLRLFQAAGDLFYDETPLPRLDLEALDMGAVRHYLRETDQLDLDDDLERLLRNWRLFDGHHPTIAGLLLFGWEPQRELPFAHIVAARFPGIDDSGDPIDRKDLGGRLLDVIDQASRFLQLHLTTGHEISGFDSELRPEFPEAALREAIVNAVAHRDYTVPGPVRLFVLDDRVEIHTPGRPPNTVDEAAMRAGVHVVRNPHVYARLADAGLVTRAGTGVRRIVRLVREATGRDIGLRLTNAEVLLSLPRQRA